MGLGEEGHGVNLHLWEAKIFSKKYIGFIVLFKAFYQKYILAFRNAILHNVVGPVYNFKNSVLP